MGTNNPCGDLWGWWYGLIFPLGPAPILRIHARPLLLSAQAEGVLGGDGLAERDVNGVAAGALGVFQRLTQHFFWVHLGQRLRPQGKRPAEVGGQGKQGQQGDGLRQPDFREYEMGAMLGLHGSLLTTRQQ